MFLVKCNFDFELHLSVSQAFFKSISKIESYFDFEVSPQKFVYYIYPIYTENNV
jgi:hypothetical protein